MSRIYQHQLASELAGLFDQGAFRGGDRAIGGFACHRRLGQELWPEIFDCDSIEIDRYRFRPFAAGIGALGSDAGVLFGRSMLGGLVPTRRGPTLVRSTSGHHPLIPRQPMRGSRAVLEVRQVVVVTGCRRHVDHAPVDPDRAARCGQRLYLGPRHDEGTPPPAQRVPVDSHTRRLAGKITRPHRPHHDPSGQAQLATVEDEPTQRVVQAGGRPVPGFELGHAAPPPRRQFLVLAVLENLGAGPPEILDCLLLSHTGPCRQPLMLAAPPGQPLIKLRWAAFRLHAGLNPLAVRGVRGLHALIPYPPAPVPLCQQQPSRTNR